MKPVLYLHLGPTKTGTKDLQHWLDIHTQQLAEIGYVYPQKNMVLSRIGNGTSAGLSDWMYALVSEPSRILELENCILSDTQSIIISAENCLYLELFRKEATIEQLSKIFSDYTVKILFVARRQDVRNNSDYAESVSGGWHKITCPPMEYYQLSYEKGLLDYQKLLEPWERVFGAKNIIGLPYVNENEGGIIPFFCKAIGLSDFFVNTEQGNFFLGGSRTNPTPDWNAVMLLRECNRLNIKSSKYRKFVGEFRRYAAQVPNSRKRFFYTPNECRKILADHAESNTFITQKYLQEYGDSWYTKPHPIMEEQKAVDNTAVDLRYVEKMVDALNALFLEDMEVSLLEAEKTSLITKLQQGLQQCKERNTTLDNEQSRQREILREEIHNAVLACTELQNEIQTEVQQKTHILSESTAHTIELLRTEVQQKTHILSESTANSIELLRTEAHEDLQVTTQQMERAFKETLVRELEQSQGIVLEEVQSLVQNTKSQIKNDVSKDFEAFYIAHLKSTESLNQRQHACATQCAELEKKMQDQRQALAVMERLLCATFARARMTISRRCARFFRSPRLDEIKFLRRHTLIDIDFYWEQYPDVKQAGISPFEHYVWHGAAEGRNPSPLFNTLQYFLNNPAVCVDGLNPLVHYALGQGFKV